MANLDRVLGILQWALYLAALSWPALLLYHMWVAGIGPLAPARDAYHDTYYVVVHFGNGPVLSIAAALCALGLGIWRYRRAARS
ncbi:hypothetical protein ACW9UR_17335 [Halovulum sp. GXIMD14794]